MTWMTPAIILAAVIAVALALAVIMPHFGFNTPGPNGYQP